MNDVPPVILLVEDNEDDVFAFKRAFGKASAVGSLRVVTDGKQALEYLFADGEFKDRELYPSPRIVFLDLKLPYFSGHEILEKMNAVSMLTTTSVVILSGSDESRDHERADSNGAAAYLVKPAEPSEIRRLVELLSAERMQ